MEELIPQSRQEAMLRNIVLAASGESVTDELVPQWDDEKFLDDILKAAQGESPVYNIEPRWHHQKFYKAIADALAAAGGGVELVGTKEFEVNATGSSTISVGNIPLDADKVNENTVLCTVVRDKAGKRNGYFMASLTISVGSGSVVRRIAYVKSNTITYMTSASSAVYGGQASFSGETPSVPIQAKYNSAYCTVTGTYLCEVYAINLPVFDGNPIT